MNEPRRRLDPLALAVHGVALAAILAAGVYLLFAIRSDPQPAKTDSQTVGDFLGGIAKSLEKLVERENKPAPPVRKPAPPSTAKPAPAKPATAAKAASPTGKPAPIMLALPDAGRWWRYRVTVEPPAWREITLTYRAVEQAGALAIHTEFRHSGGETKFVLGTFAFAHPSHANTRFPGFFMYPAYLKGALEVGRKFTWHWPWQLPGGAVRADRVKQYSSQVLAWEDVTTPAGKFSAARIEVTLNYIENGSIMGTAHEMLWYSPQAFQLVKVVREGRTPDESSHRIVAELVELR